MLRIYDQMWLSGPWPKGFLDVVYGALAVGFYDGQDVKPRFKIRMGGSDVGVSGSADFFLFLLIHIFPGLSIGRGIAGFDFNENEVFLFLGDDIYIGSAVFPPHVQDEVAAFGEVGRGEFLAIQAFGTVVFFGSHNGH
jgi:hypothetical protein